MTDMLVKLYELPDVSESATQLAVKGVRIERALALDRGPILDFVRSQFENAGWQGECHAALARQPTTCFIAVQHRRLIGFACYDSTAKGFFGPFGVATEHRGAGIGRLLLVSTLTAMSFDGYGYAIIGWVNSQDYYQRAVGAVAIPDSFPGVYGAGISQS